MKRKSQINNFFVTIVLNLEINSEHDFLKDTMKAFNDFKNKQQKCMKQSFSICKSMHILKVYSIHYTFRWNRNIKKNSSGHNKLYEKCIHPCNASFRKLHLINFTFNLQFLQELKHMAHISKNVCWIFQFRFHLIFIKFYIFVQQKTWTLWL